MTKAKKDKLRAEVIQQFAKTLKEYREANDLLPADIGYDLRLSHYQIITYEDGTHEPRLSTFIALADYFGISLDEMAGRVYEN